MVFDQPEEAETGGLYVSLFIVAPLLEAYILHSSPSQSRIFVGEISRALPFIDTVLRSCGALH